MKSKSKAQLDLRAQAEAQLAAAPAATMSRPTDVVLHELQVHQIELEMQNEALREAQVALEESRDRYLSLYEFAPVGYLTLGHTGCIEAINLAGAALLGKDRKKLYGQRFASYVAPADQDRWYMRFMQALRHDSWQPIELEIQRSDGSCSFVQVGGRPATSRGLHIMLTDITTLKRIMTALQVREDRLRLAKAAAGLGIFDDNLGGGGHMVDERLREIWGFGPDEPVTFEQIIAGMHPDDRAATQVLVEQALNPGGSGKYCAEYRVINRVDGNVRHVSATGQVYFKDGHAIRFVGTVKDISLQKRLELEARERRSEMELLVNQQVAAQTAAAIAHELNQPLSAISTFSDTALRMLRAGTKNPEKLLQALEGAMEQAQRAGRTLNELLDFLHKSEAKTERVDLSIAIHEALAITADSGYDEFQPVVDLERDLPPVLANRLQIKKVLVNLLRNSVEAMRDAEVPKEAITITVRTHSCGTMAQVTVRDSGPGLDKETARRIFDSFFTTKPEGMGLGLAISRALVEAHGGQLWVDVDSGPGATFHFTLPFAS